MAGESSGPETCSGDPTTRYKPHSPTSENEHFSNLLTPGVLVACKCDLEARREVSEERGRELAASKDLVYFETSAVRELFNT